MFTFKSVHAAEQPSGRLALLSFVLLAGSGVVRAQAPALEWNRDYSKAVALATESSKPMLLDFWADWCAPCKVMEKEVYGDAALIRAVTGKMVLLKIDFDKQQELARKYSVSALPFLVFTDSYGSELFTHHGMIDAPTLTAAVQALPGDVTEFNRMHLALEENKNDFEALQGLGRELRSAGLFTKSNEYYAKSLKNGAARKNVAARERILLDVGLNYLVLQQPAEAIKTLEAAVKEFPESKSGGAFRLNLARAYAMAQKKDKARQTIEALLRKNPDSPESQQAKELLGTL